MPDAHDFVMEFLAGKTRRERLMFRFYMWRAKHIGHPRRQRRWDRAVSVIRDEDFYVISDHDFFAGVEAGLWDDTYGEGEGWPMIARVR